ncbi:Glutathione/L-cysteine transport system ATP-binding/permease protein CydC [Trichinella spiralis]|uniref:Glutathione/L-cysteine transport system ATP-binding/permease protein CydC n=1 Tax=Trichinella spiralis TaxID=6334 RepID=A0ABR3KJF0_TRISP
METKPVDWDFTELIANELGKQLRSWQKSTPGSPQHPYTRTDAKGALKDNGNYSAKAGIKPLPLKVCLSSVSFSVSSASRDVLPTRSCMQRLLLANASLGNRRIPS